MNTKPPHDNCSVRMTEFSNPRDGTGETTLRVRPIEAEPS
jgi:hypothetical protein